MTGAAGRGRRTASRPWVQSGQGQGGDGRQDVPTPKSGSSRATGTRSSGARVGGSPRITAFVTSPTPAAAPRTAPPRPARAVPARSAKATPAAVPTPAGPTAAQKSIARMRRRLDAISNRQQLRLTAIKALQDSVRSATSAAPPVATPATAAGSPSTGAVKIDRDRGLSYEQLLISVLTQHLDLGQSASRPAVEEDADTIADTVAELLAALPEFDGPWGPAIGPVYRTDQVRALLGGVSRQALSDRAKRHTLLTLKTRDGVNVYPAWQFSEGQVLAALPEVLKLFAPDEDGETVDAWTLASWLRTNLDELEGDSVSGRLRAGKHDQALAAARSAAARWSR